MQKKELGKTRTMKRLTSGNVFKIIDDTEIRYFQYFYSDMNYLGGDLIWVFNLEKDTTDLDEIVNSGYSFYFYTTINAGVKMKKWSLLGNKVIPSRMDYYPSFRWKAVGTEDWFILTFDKKEYIGKTLTEEQMKLPFASITFPVEAKRNMILGKGNFKDLF